jgi:hypothetical protein
MKRFALPPVRVGPGATVLTRTPWAAYSAVQALVSDSTAALDAP